MTSTQLLFVLLGAYFLIYGLIWLLLLRLGLYWAKIPRGPWWKPLAVTVLSVISPVLLVFFFALPKSNSIFLIALGVRGVVYILVPCLVIMFLYQVRFVKAMQAWVPTVIPMGILTILAAFVIRPYLFEGFSAPTNAMAPTIVGKHWEAVCEKCGSTCYCTPMEEPMHGDESPLMICERFHVTRPRDHDEHVYSSDRFLVAKFYEPRRWDLIVFDLHTDPYVKYVKRLVGLPGEVITIHDSQVYADGTALTPPDSLRGIQYVTDVGLGEAWGSPENPVVLGEDEYFVLGDFSQRSSDSRFWHKGAPGHPPYAVPKSYIRGVVINIYWPRTRWRTFR
jgi:signal peptidase I